MKNKGITLITLVITIILLIILASVAINMSVGENGIFNRTKQAKEKYDEASAREKLETVLAEVIVEKETNAKYDSGDFLDDLLTNENMSVSSNIVTVNNYNFLIDREKLKIVESIGKTTVKVKSEVQEYLGKNENDKYRVSSIVTIESNIEIESIKITNPDGTSITLTTDKQELTKDIEMILDEEYKIEVKTKNREIDTQTIVEKSEEEIRSVEDFIKFRDKVNSGLTYEGKTLKLTTDLDLSNVCGSNVNGKEISWEPIAKGNNKFKGTFDGDYHKINNLYIKSGENYSGLFSTNYGTIQKIILDTGDIHYSSVGNGALVGVNYGTILNSCNRVTVNSTSSSHIGGICGTNARNYIKLL